MKLSQTQDAGGGGRRRREEYHEDNGEAAPHRVATFARRPLPAGTFFGAVTRIIPAPIRRMRANEKG